MHRHLAAVLVLALLAGCAQYWARPGGTNQAFDAAKARCQSEAFARYPAGSRGGAIDQELIAPKPDLCVDAIHGIQCMSNGGQFSPIRLSPGMSGPAREMFGTCMAAAGWRPVANAAQGEAITRGGG